MPELPEVEVCRQGLAPAVVGRRVRQLTVRFPMLRAPIPPDLPERLRDVEVVAIERRGKYLLFDCRRPTERGWLIIHLGMSGSLRLLATATPPTLHDHVDIDLGGLLLRYRDPRRFGVIAWQEGAEAARHPLLCGLGTEPLGQEFCGDWLYRATRARRSPIKTLLMDAGFLVGVGNIYAAESLFLSGISPLRPAGRLGRAACDRLAAAVRNTLIAAIAAGGSSIRDYVHHDGGRGDFQLDYAVYGRTGEVCRRCAGIVRCIRQGGRSTFYCPGCQR